MAMERYTPEQIAEILRLHRLWLRDEEGGVRANLAGAYLAGANLDGANLDGANLDGAYLDGANLAGANLVRANLVRANLAGAYLAGANLVRANLAGAYLAGANLDGANLAGANLAGAYLDGANLAGANLAGANLAGANLDGANLDGANLAGAYLDGARGFLPFLCIGPIGSRNGYTTASLVKDEIRCGCFTGTLDEFQAKVKKTHKDSPVHLASYLALVAMVTAARAAQPPREETPDPPAPFAERDLVQITEAGRKAWPWAPTDQGRVMRCAGGWTRIDFPSCYLSVPDGFLEPAQVAEKAGV